MFYCLQSASQTSSGWNLTTIAFFSAEIWAEKGKVTFLKLHTVLVQLFQGSGERPGHVPSDQDFSDFLTIALMTKGGEGQFTWDTGCRKCHHNVGSVQKFIGRLKLIETLPSI